jgi:glyoxylase-like metal-dependent hydrolase (beta-lactamase superfamily II)
VNTHVYNWRSTVEQPIFLHNQQLAGDTTVLRAYTPAPGMGVLPVNAFVIRAAQPVLVDTGMVGLRQPFMDHLRRAIDPGDLRWIWLTHTDPDHVGNLEAVLAEAPRARVVTTYLGMGKLGLLGLPIERCYLLNPGQRLDAGDRELLAVAPPSFDAPETTGLMDSSTGFLYSADCFGALLEAPHEFAADLAAPDLEAGLVTWSSVDAPWLRLVDERRFGEALAALSSLAPAAVLSSHLPPAFGMLGDLVRYLAAARTAPAFVGPDQSALERMMAGAA